MSASPSGLWALGLIGSKCHLRQGAADRLGWAVCGALVDAAAPDPRSADEDHVCGRCHGWVISHCIFYLRE
ncbi:hypothetical protein EV193_101490 [Herbihabitans rhizosphaerae]|uniref:Uncharacterized protein n=1 Tax=Herbihabitans rhizosphaerae TaxID=1872711 RepID=A0A4Q7L5Q6_9PSEU|nr:hypothetical protein [Herbihabitans rhizosphaerae]RZS44614.1 hypothetical protein EV193_101490 [Herbihabitans rhizosphaerae]